jgi:hypothetical protein
LKPEIVSEEDNSWPGDIALDFDTADTANAVETFLKNISKVEVEPGLNSVYRDPNKGWWRLFWGAVLLVLWAIAAYFLYQYHTDYPDLSFGAAAVWTIGVPIYFFWEDQFYFAEHGNPAEYERFKRIQDLAAKIWAAAVAVLGAIIALKVTGYIPD